MTLLMKLACERCNTTLTLDGAAFICTYECTFCAQCAEAMYSTCPNCGGELVPRPPPQVRRNHKPDRDEAQPARKTIDTRSQETTKWHVTQDPSAASAAATEPNSSSREPSASQKNAPSRNATSPPASTASPAK